MGLVSYWRCVTDNSGITTYGIMSLGREMSTPPIPSRSMAHFTFTITCGRNFRGVGCRSNQSSVKAEVNRLNKVLSLDLACVLNQNNLLE